MPNPQVLDFSAAEEDAITIVFPGGRSCELPTADELNMETFQWVARNGDEWQQLFEKKGQTPAERKRFGHLNNHLVYALCSEIPRSVIDQLSDKRKAKIIIAFMSASPDLLELAKEIASEAAPKKPAAKPKTSRS